MNLIGFYLILDVYYFIGMQIKENFGKRVRRG